MQKRANIQNILKTPKHVIYILSNLLSCDYFTDISLLFDADVRQNIFFYKTRLLRLMLEPVKKEK